MFGVVFECDRIRMRTEIASRGVESKFYRARRIFRRKNRVFGQKSVFRRHVSVKPAVKIVADDLGSARHFRQNGVARQSIYSVLRNACSRLLYKIGKRLFARGDIIIPVFIQKRYIHRVLFINAHGIIFNKRIVQGRNGNIKEVFSVVEKIDDFRRHFFLPHFVEI